jgi:hypothetical protein
LILAGLGIIWAAFLVPSLRRRRSPSTSVEDFERRMELLAQAETHGGPGRWIITPRKGARFVGPEERRRARARERRRRVLVFLLESIGLSFLIGLAPPLRMVWIGTAVLGFALLLYVWLLLAIKHRFGERAHERVAAATAGTRAAAHRAALAAQRYVAEGHSARPRPHHNGLGVLGEGDVVHVVVRPAHEVRAARA